MFFHLIKTSDYYKHALVHKWHGYDCPRLDVYFTSLQDSRSSSRVLPRIINGSTSTTVEEKRDAIYFADILSLTANSIGQNVPQACFASAFIETFNLKMQEAALESSNTAILINPNYADAIGLKASILNNLERPEEALRRWIRQKINPNFPVEYLQIETIFYMMLGQ